MVTMKTLADHAGVSVSVVSAVISGSKYVRMSEETRGRVLQAIKDLNYVPNYAARSLRLAKSNVLAVVVPHISDPIYSRMLDGIYRGADELGCVVLLGDAARVRSGSELLNRILGQGQVDGVLVRPSATLGSELFHEVGRHGTPMVVLDELDDPDVVSIASDDTAGMAVAVQHLAALGHRDIAFLGGEERYNATRARIEGFRAAMAARDLDVRSDWITYSHQEAVSGYRAMLSLLDGSSRPTAMIVNNITTALGVLAAASDRGVAVPSQLSIVAYHDTHEAEFSRPALTTVAMPMAEWGYEGVLALGELREGRSVASRRVTSPEPRLVVRGSTAPPTP